ncbi:hypothetical protein [Paenibacillus contaminans]|uniref:Uncharacterized protein n=1 Tax=Paenibacillus contaminans TaxID=450362 RepID=A0A329MLT1_9BACL|nr:hypothetical protein [Paenibacillus contaminans]RAV18847.1 hypothetical protein DQG23_24265 [Paenibacillus contaminans]
MDQNKQNKPLIKKWWFWALIVIVIIIAANISGKDDEVKDMATNATPTVTPSPKNTPQGSTGTVSPTSSTTPTQQKQEVDWKKEIGVIAKTEKSTTEKFDEVTKLARSYKSDQSELKEFESFIVSEFKNGSYLKDTKNHEYMLNNIFKATVVERHYDDKEKKPIDSFALDFIQNSKYTYRGVETIDSDSVKSNEDQMKKSMAQIK